MEKMNEKLLNENLKRMDDSRIKPHAIEDN